MEHSDNLYNSLVKYFTMLETTGYYDTRETRNLIIYLFIVNEIFEGNLSRHLDDEGLAQIRKALKCLYNGCLISAVRSNVRFKEPREMADNSAFRYSEDSAQRISENMDVRTIDSEE